MNPPIQQCAGAGAKRVAAKPPIVHPVTVPAAASASAVAAENRELNRLLDMALADYLGSCDPVSLAKNQHAGVPEFEVRFGTSSKSAVAAAIKPFTKVDYDSVVHEIMKHDWVAEDIAGTMLLRVTPGTIDMPSASGHLVQVETEADIYGGAPNKHVSAMTKYNMANIRAEFVGPTMISEYCKSDSIERILNHVPGAGGVVKFTQKNYPKRPIGPKESTFIAFPDFNFRVSSQFERQYSATSDNVQIQSMVSNWTTMKKHFRCMNRTRFRHRSDPNSYVLVDISIVRSNRTYTGNNGKPIPIPAQTSSEAGIFNDGCPESFEIELELDNDRITKAIGDKQIPLAELHQRLAAQLRSAIRMVLSGLQETMYPVTYSEQDVVLNEYMRCLHGENWIRPFGKGTTDMPAPYFVGPSSVTLQLEHVVSTKNTPIEPKFAVGMPELVPELVPELEPNQNTEQPDEITGGGPKRDNKPNAQPPDRISILSNYCVTEKADGNRALLYVASTGKIYLINTNLKVVFTGAKTDEKKCLRCIFDGEYIAYGKTREFLNLYAAFDVYYAACMPTVNIRALPFCRSTYRDQDTDKYRLLILETLVALLRPTSVVATQTRPCLMQVQAKQFYIGYEGSTANETMLIYEQSANIWRKKHQFDYEIDGMIYTPTDLGVGGDRPGQYNNKPKKYAWNRSFKWKPPQFNTVDFLVRSIKDKGGKKEKIFTQIPPESSTTSTTNTLLISPSNIVRYKRLVLHCGFNDQYDKFMNPVHDMLHDTLTRKTTNTVDESGDGKLVHATGSGSYRPVPFIPSTPYDVSAQFCNLRIGTAIADTFMRTTEGDVFSDNMIVEFRYDKQNFDSTNGADSSWCWVPIRIRYDKTSKLRAGETEFGNPYAVANDNWKSIHFPVTEQIICGECAPNYNQTEDAVYYNRSELATKSETRALRDFHNLYVKRFLIERVASYLKKKMAVRKVNLMDLAVGKAGDLPKWKFAGINFVFGVDIAKDNIVNSNDGAVVRYLTSRQKSNEKNDDVLRAIFVHGDSGANIRSTGAAYYTDQDRQISQAIFGDNDSEMIRKQVADRFWRIGHDGFHMTSCQFAMHYFFRSPRSLHSFMRNLSECTKKDGYFVGTCYDGQAVFDLLRTKGRGESVVYTKNGQKIFEVVKEYTTDTFPETEESIGMAISVYQESINTMNREYLVNFVYFERLMSEYGFVPLPVSESRSMGFGDRGRNSFRYMFNELHSNKQSNIGFGLASTMNGGESNISFLNQYFVYKKIRDVSIPEMKQLIQKYVQEDTNVVVHDSKNEVVNVKNAANFARKIPGRYIILR